MKVLAIFMEPAPYIEGLVRELRRCWGGNLEVVFIARSLTQKWEAQDVAAFLPEGRMRALRRIWSRLRGDEVRLLHVCGWGHPVLAASILMARARRIPVVCETDTQRPGDESAWKRWLKARLYPPLFSLPARFLPAGARQSDYLKDYRVPQGAIREARMTVDVTRIGAYASRSGASARSELRNRMGLGAETLFLYLGRLEPFKGLQDLFEAWLSLRTTRSDIALAVAGSGSLGPFVREAAASIRGVHDLGHLTGERVWQAYCAADVFVLPSRREPWGLVVNEAMAAGRPVIVSAAAGCVGDLVRDGVTGLVYPARDTKALMKAMAALACDPALRRNLAEEAEREIAGWTLEGEAGIATDVWKEVLQCAGAG